MSASVSVPSTRPIGRTLLVGYGKLGSRLARSLTADDSEVIALRRTATLHPGDVREITADVSMPLPFALPAVDSMVVTLPPGERIDSYRTALTHVRNALVELPSRTLFVSSTGVFAGAEPEPVLTERDEPVLTSDRARALRDGERAAEELFSAVVVRPAGIYGPGRDFLVRRVREHAPIDFARWTNRIHETDLVRTLEALLRMPEPPALLHAVDGAPVLLGNVVRRIAQMLETELPPELGVPGPSGHVLDGTLLRQVLPRLAYPSYVEGYAEMIG